MSRLLPRLLGLGGIGLFGVAIIDSSMIPLPIPGSTDLVLLLLTAPRYTSVGLAISFVAWAVAGSIVGGYITWDTGRRGGTNALVRYVPARFLDPIISWIKRHGPVSLSMAALLPPPIPMLPFLLAAGALGIPRSRFLWSYSVARIVRYSLIGWFGFTYGRRFIEDWRQSLSGWYTPILCIYLGAVVLGAGYGLWKIRREYRKNAGAN